MYNKLFTKILDSSIWLEATPTRIVWVTFIACMDQDGIVQLSSIGNVASRARVTEEEATGAITCLESPDTKNPDQEHEGRRIERVPGVGWFVINHGKYRDMVTAEMVRAGNRERQRRHRLTPPVTERHGFVTPSVSISESVSEARSEEEARSVVTRESLAVIEKTGVIQTITENDRGFAAFWLVYPKRVGKGAALKAWKRINPQNGLNEAILAAVEKQKLSPQWRKEHGQFIPHPATWLNQTRWEDDCIVQQSDGLTDRTRRNIESASRAIAKANR